MTARTNWIARNGRTSYRAGFSGFTLIELLVAVSLIALLVAASYPSYSAFTRKSHRTVAMRELADWAQRQENWRADRISYSTALAPANTEHHAYSAVASTGGYTLTATALGEQAKDKEDGISCAVLTYAKGGKHGPAGAETCWALQ